MSEAPLATAPAEPPAEEAPKLAGKFVTPDDLQQGIRELAKTIEYPISDGDLIGPDSQFPDVDTAVTAYNALNRMRSRMQDTQEPAATVPVETPPDSTPDKIATTDEPTTDANLQVAPAPPADLDLNVVLERAGLTEESIAEQFQSSSELTEDQYNKLQSQLPSVSRKMINDYLTAVQAATVAAQGQRNDMVAKAVNMVGGQQQLDTLKAWAASNIPSAELGDPEKPDPGTINHRLLSPALYESAVRELSMRHRESIGAAGTGTLVDTSGAPAVAPAGNTIASRPEYFKIVNRASRGDEAAQQQLLQHRRSGGNYFA